MVHHYRARSIIYIRVHPMGLDKCIRTYTLVIVSRLKIPFSFYSSLPSTQLWVTTDLFSVSTVLPFSEYYIVGLIQ